MFSNVWSSIRNQLSKNLYIKHCLTCNDESKHLLILKNGWWVFGFCGHSFMLTYLTVFEDKLKNYRLPVWYSFTSCLLHLFLFHVFSLSFTLRLKTIHKTFISYFSSARSILPTIAHSPDELPRRKNYTFRFSFGDVNCRTQFFQRNILIHMLIIVSFWAKKCLNKNIISNIELCEICLTLM